MAKRLVWLMAICGYAFAMTSAVADGHNQRYFVPMLTFIDDDEQRRVDDQLGGVMLSLGQPIGEQMDIELSGFMGNWEGFDETEQYGVAADLHLLLGDDRDAKLLPYFIVGTGYMNTLSTLAPDDAGMIASLGVGADWRLKPGVAVRADLRQRRDFASSSSVDDTLFSVGFKINLGKTAPRRVDSDGDGVYDDVDRCPGTPAGTVVDSSGCEPDGDRDGVVDRLDKCPDTRRGARVDAKGCEIVRDGDGDGVADGRDRCPNTPAGARVDANGCEFDTDADGVVDRLDKCPGTPAGTRVDARGCPLKQEIRLEGVFFELNSAKLRADAVTRLDQAVQTLKLNSDLEIEVAGHTDSSGAAAYNQTLSQRRAEAVRDYLVSKGISADRLRARGYGESQPIESNDTTQGRAKNRRVMLRILNENVENPARPEP